MLVVPNQWFLKFGAIINIMGWLKKENILVHNKITIENSKMENVQQMKNKWVKIGVNVCDKTKKLSE